MKKKVISVICIIAMVGTMLVGCGSKTTTATTETTTETTEAAEAETEVAEAREVTKITIAVPDPEASYIYTAATEFANRAMEYSNGTLDIEISGNGSLYGGDTAAGIKQLSAGSLQMLVLATSVYASFEPAYNVISVPYMFDDQAQLLDYLNSDTGVDLMNRVESLGITSVGSWTRSFREVTNSKKPITSPDDLKGLVLRVPNNSLYVEFFNACGAVTTPMNFSEVYNALQLNTLDGQENPVDVPYSNKFYEVQKYISFTNHMADVWLVGINSKFYAGLTQEQQDAINKAGDEVQQWNVDMMAEKDQLALSSLEENGMESNQLKDEARQQFVEISQSLYPKFEELIQDDDLLNATAEFTGKTVE
ncbi:MAG: DctP family TRAP transporter solute-binding subunit [Lachnospiraceae bacterium]|nr:DctP family TRAP transporter solute-binding subunit [Lachnospiraceae bacterium]